ncbi:MAG: hypothetical protein WKF67_11135 [Rubrobacteraceae bacterium]
MELPFWLRVVESLAAVATPILIAVGGVFAWYKFFRQGEHDPRLQPSVTATAEIRGEDDKIACVFATVTAQNSGQVEVELVPEGSALDVYTTTLEEDGWWQYPDPLKVFVGQGRVRPGETLEDQKLIQIRYSDEIAVRLDLTITAVDSTVTEHKTRTWDTIEIVPLPSGEGGQSEQSG